MTDTTGKQNISMFPGWMQQCCECFVILLLTFSIRCCQQKKPGGIFQIVSILHLKSEQNLRYTVTSCCALFQFVCSHFLFLVPCQWIGEGGYRNASRPCVCPSDTISFDLSMYRCPASHNRCISHSSGGVWKWVMWHGSKVKWGQNCYKPGKHDIFWYRHISMWSFAP